MDRVQAEESIQLIRDMMERSVRYTHFSGLSGVLSGILALLGCAATWWADINVPADSKNAWYIIIWTIVLIVAIVQDMLIAQRHARQNGGTIWVPATYQVIKAVVPSLFGAFVISLFALQINAYNILPGIWALGYGAALCAAGMFSIKEVRIYGIVQLTTGALGLLWFRQAPYYFYQMALSFGVFQIIYGLWMTRTNRS